MSRIRLAEERATWSEQPAAGDRTGSRRRPRDERRRSDDGATGTTPRSVWRTCPWFVVGFTIAALVNSHGWLPASASAVLPTAAKALITFTIAGVGLNTDLSDVRRIGAAPMAVGLIGTGVMAVVSFALLRWVT